MTGILFGASFEYLEGTDRVFRVSVHKLKGCRLGCRLIIASTTAIKRVVAGTVAWMSFLRWMQVEPQATQESCEEQRSTARRKTFVVRIASTCVFAVKMGHEIDQN